ncbi:MAG: hypothetical protein KDA49_15425, partial [Rhodospirillaceae bacterium]|nr:hypothetical protein [Rhodospirillaceae bacterium]
MTSQFQVPDTPPVVQYIADGSQTGFAFPFPIIDAADLQVLVGAGDLSASVEIAGVGTSDGGTVEFPSAPAAGQVVTLRRAMAYQRTTDFLQGAALRADAFNEAFDRQVMMVQQVADQMGRAVRAADFDLPASLVLPDRASRAGCMLGFDGEGNLQLVAGDDAATPYFVASPGGAARDVYAKLQDAVSVKDFGAVGDGTTDDTPAFLAALAGAAAVEVPTGRYRLTATLTLTEGQSLWGRGDASVLAMESALPLLVISGGYTSVHHLRLEGGSVGVRLKAAATACVNNVLGDLSLWDQGVGIELDGGDDTAKPCYWNNVHDVLVARPTGDGVHLHVSGAGDTPNANRFARLRVYSLAAATTGSGIHVEDGRFNNSFTDCEVNLADTAHSCVRLGAASDGTLFVNLYTETTGGVANVLLEAGSANTSLTNLLAASGGAAISDLSGGAYTARNAGYPERNRLALTRATELVVERLGFDIDYLEPAGGGTVEPDLAKSVYLVSASGGAVTFVLPAAADAAGRQVMVKKVDGSDDAVSVEEDGGSGPDGRAAVLAARYEQVTVLSDGTDWHVVASSKPRIDGSFHDSEAVVTVDPGRPIHLVSAFSGAVTVNLPDPTDAQSIGRLLTVKKTDPSGNAVTVTRAGGTGPDNANVTLSSQYAFVSAYCDG